VEVRLERSVAKRKQKQKQYTAFLHNEQPPTPFFAHRRFKRFLEDAADMKALPSDMRTPVFKIILKNGGDKAFEEVKGYFETATDNAEKKHVLNSIGEVSGSEERSDEFKVAIWVTKMVRAFTSF